MRAGRWAMARGVNSQAHVVRARAIADASLGIVLPYPSQYALSTDVGTAITSGA
jgi:hypothetical protein